MEDDDLNLTLSTGEDIIIDDLDTVTIGNIDLSDITGLQTATIAPLSASNMATITLAGSGGGGAGYGYNGATWTASGATYTLGPTWNNTTYANSAGIKVSGNAEIDGDLTVAGVSILSTLNKINQRLAILTPDPARLEKYEALKQAYEHYKTLEALCIEESNSTEKK